MSLPPDIEGVATLGWRLYPASNRTKHACFRGATDAATSDLNQLSRWAREFPNCNWRVVMSGSGIWGLDCDHPTTHAHDGIANLKALIATHSPLPPRPMARSGGNGLLLFFRHTKEPLIGDSGHPAPGIDPRRGRQSQTIPPSRHTVTRQPYRWLTTPWDTPPPDAPEWLLKLLQPLPEPKRPDIPATSDFARGRLYRAAGAIADSINGSRNNTLNRRAFQIGRYIAAGLCSEAESFDVLYAAARHAGLDHNEATNTIKSGFTSGMGRRNTRGC